MDSNAKTATSVTKRRVRVEYTSALAEKIDKLMDGQTKLEVQLAAIQSSMMLRPEINAEMEKRVMLGAYIADKTALEQRVKDLEEAPQSTWTRFSIIMTSGMGCLALLISSGSAIIGIISIIVSHPLK